MKKKEKFQKGAISVFLVIILIPCMVFSSMFVDMSRVVLAKGVATSASDLAMNSLMANFDAELADYYGLVASCQNIDEFYEESAQYFLDALYSQGLSADDAESLLGYFNAMVKNDDVHDMFQMEIQTETKDIITPVKNASLGESAVIIKDQLVDFMKYRAPIKVTEKIIARLQDANIADTLGNASKDEELVEDKKEYAESEESFMDAAFKTYKALLAYENTKMSVTKSKKVLSDMKAARETYREVVKLMVSNLNGTSGLTKFTRPNYKIDTYEYDETSSKVYSRKEKDDAGKYTYYIDGSKITKLLDDLEDKIDTFKNKRKNVETKATDELINASIGTGNNQYNPIQWWKKVNSLINNGNNSPIEQYKKAAKNMLDAYAKVLAIKDCTLGKKIPSGWEDRYDSLTQSVKDLQKDFLTKNVGEKNNNKYLRLVNKLEKYSKENASKVSPDKVKLANGKTVSQAIKDVDTVLSQHVTDLNAGIQALDKLIDGGGFLLNNPYSLSNLSSKANEYHKDYEAWKNNAKVEDTKMAENDWASIQELESKGQVLDVSAQEILDLKTRLINVRTRLKSIVSKIESMTFGGKKLINIDSYNTAYNAVKSSIGENLKNSAVSSKANSLFKSKFTPYSADKNAEVASYNFEESKYNPDLTVSSPEFYKWLKTKFKNTDDSKVEEEKNKVDGKESEGDTASKNAKEKDRSGHVSKTNLYGNKSYAAGDFPSGLDANLRFKLGESIISSLGTIVKSLVNMEIDSIRDSLYSTEYVMDMFSYATYENEGKYKLGMETKGWSADDAEKAYAKNQYGDVKGSATTKKSWLSTDLVDGFNKTLTNKMINSTNNVLNGAEVEYVLYGKENKTNIKDAYVDIFEIRYIVNSLSGFQNFWNATSNETAGIIEGLATTISAATSGIVPVPAIKVVAILLLTALETAEDLNRLQKGFQVEFYKTEDDWRYSINADFSTKSGNNQACAAGLFYSDYLYLFVLLGFQSGSASEMYRRTADLVQVNMRKAVGDDGYVLKNARSYFQISATIRVSPLMLALPMAQEFANNPSDRSDWCTFTIKETRGYS